MLLSGNQSFNNKLNIYVFGIKLIYFVYRYDEGNIMLKVGREEPAMSMDINGCKIIWARHSELQLANLKKVDAPDVKGDAGSIKDGEILSVEVKDMGSCEIYPQSIAHNPNGRYFIFFI